MVHSAYLLMKKKENALKRIRWILRIQTRDREHSLAEINLLSVDKGFNKFTSVNHSVVYCHYNTLQDLTDYKDPHTNNRDMLFLSEILAEIFMAEHKPPK